jgi:glycosyltransferase involved in cell wall biosynthesis
LAIANELRNDFEILLVAGEPEHGEESAAYLLETYTGFEVKMLSSIKRSVVPFNDWNAYTQLKQIISQFQPHIVHTHGSKPGVLARFAAWRLKVPVIVHTYHGHVFHSYFSNFVSSMIVRVEKWLAKRSSFVIAINERLQHELEMVYKIAPSTKIILNRLGIDAEKMNDVDGSKCAAFRKEFAIDTSQVAIGIIGRLVPVKNHRGFIQLVSELLATKQHGFKFFIVGDGDEKPKLEQLLLQKNIPYTKAGASFDPSASVVFTSWRRDMDVVLAGLDLVVLTSFNEGTPVSIMEAMAAGKPVIAANVGGIAELFQNNQNGWVYDDFKDLPHLCLKMLENKQLYTNISHHAKEYALANLSLQNQARHLKKAYSAALKGS